MNRENMIKMMTIADHYGYESQSRQLIEEMAELTKAINKEWRVAKRKKPKKMARCRKNIIEEIADVEVMIEQMKYLLNCQLKTERVIRKKLERQLKRIANDR